MGGTWVHPCVRVGMAVCLCVSTPVSRYMCVCVCVCVCIAGLSMLATGGVDGRIRLWDLQLGALLRACATRVSAVCVCVSCGSVIVVACACVWCVAAIHCVCMYVCMCTCG